MDDEDSGVHCKPESESSFDEERSAPASVERSPCAVNMTVSPTSLLSDEHSSNDVSSTTDCAIITSVRIDSTSSSKSKKWDKKQECKLCTKLVIKMSDHLARCHREEVEVAHVLAVKLGSKKIISKRGVTRLKAGDYLHNCKVLECGKGGTFIQVYRTQKDKIAVDFVPCSVCHGLYKKSLLYLHVQRCGKEHGVSVSRKRKAAILEGELMWPVLLAAVRELCGYGETSHSFNKGSLALMKHCSYLYRSCVLLFASCTDHMSFFSELHKNQVLKQIYLVIGSLKHINLHYYCKLEVCCVKSLKQELNSDEDVAGAAIEAAVDHSADKSQGTNAAGSSASYSNSKKREIPAQLCYNIDCIIVEQSRHLLNGQDVYHSVINL